MAVYGQKRVPPALEEEEAKPVVCVCVGMNNNNKTRRLILSPSSSSVCEGLTRLLYGVGSLSLFPSFFRMSLPL